MEVLISAADVWRVRAGAWALSEFFDMTPRGAGRVTPDRAMTDRPIEGLPGIVFQCDAGGAVKGMGPDNGAAKNNWISEKHIARDTPLDHGRVAARSQTIKRLLRAA